jgi:carboxyl-terminal processing protease
MKKDRNYLPLLIAATLAFGIALGTFLDFPVDSAGFSSNSHKSKLNKLIDFIENEYVDDVNTDSIVDLTVNSILDKLDPHSVYIAENEMRAVSQSMKGDFVGIGVNFYMYKDTIAVIKPVPGGPSDKAGIMAGDRILFADETRLFGRKLPSDTLFSKLQGTPGSEVTLAVYRKKDKKQFKVKVKRDVVSINSVDAAVMLNKTTGYIKINRFAETTYEEFRSGLEKLKKQGAASLVIDVRNNGGGYLERAVEIADEFLKDKTLIVFTKNRKGHVDKTFATKKGMFESGKVNVLINENSASASEILAGALQDNDRATIVGRRSFGKGLVQREMGFGDGSAVRLTVARYYTPTGRSIQKSYEEGNEQYFEDFEKRFESGELYLKDSIKIADTLKFRTPGGKIVYGGGGIVPDIFVPLEAKHGEETITYIMQSGDIGFFIFEEIEKDRNRLSSMDYKSFLNEMNNTDKYYHSFVAYLKKNGIDVSVGSAKPFIKRYLIAEFARQLFDDGKYYEIVLEKDPMIEAVLKADE